MFQTKTLLAILALWLPGASVSVVAQDTVVIQDKAPVATDTPQARLDAVLKEYSDAGNAYWAEVDKLPEAEQQKYMKEHPMPSASDWLPRVWSIVDEAAKTPTALKGLLWILSNTEGKDVKKRALDIAMRDYLDDAKLAPICSMLQRETSESARTFLQIASEKSTSREVKGSAILSLAKMAQGSVSTASYLASASAEDLARMEKYLGADEVARLKGLKSEEETARAEKLFERIEKEFGDVTIGSRTLGATAKAELFEIRNLGIGKVAPDIVGEDLNGIPFKLSDYRGKVVVIDFWGNW